MAKTPFPVPETDPTKKRTMWETIIVTTPVVLTVVATILAGLSSSEMSSAQYYRSMAAQMQSKVSDQWGYFQAKKLRAEQCGNTVAIIRGMSQSTPGNAEEMLQTTANVIDEMRRVILQLGDTAHPVPAAAGIITELEKHRQNIGQYLKLFQTGTTQPDGTDFTAGFLSGEIPKVDEQTIGSQQIIDAINAVTSNTSEADLDQQAGQIPRADLDKAMATANANSAAFEDALQKTNAGYRKVEEACNGISREVDEFERVARGAPDEVRSIEPADSVTAIHELNSRLSSAVAVARLNLNANRYQAEAHYNQVLAELYELEVHRQGYTSDRYRIRSKEFFYGMLGAQAGVTIATFSLAVRRRNLLWGLAASAGLAAVTFAAYVYMFV